MSIYAANLLRELVAAGHDVTMVSQYYDGAHATVYGGGPPPDVPGVTVVGLPALGEQDGGDFERDIETMIATVKREHAATPFDILHAQYGYPTGWATLLAARRHSACPASSPSRAATATGSVRAARRITRPFGGCSITRARCSSAATASSRKCRSAWGVPRERFTRVPGAVDTTRFVPGPRNRRHRRAGRGLLYHGRVDRRKGVLDFIEALDSSARARPGFRGDHLRHWARRRAGEGARRHPRPRGADVALHRRQRLRGDAGPSTRRPTSSRRPPMPRVFPTRSSKRWPPGSPSRGCEVRRRHRLPADTTTNGLLAQAGDVAAHADALASLIEDAPLRRRLATCGLEDCRANYSWQVVGRQIVGIYEALRGTTPATDFRRALEVMPCRFRERPHLL